MVQLELIEAPIKCFLLGLILSLVFRAQSHTRWVVFLCLEPTTYSFLPCIFQVNELSLKLEDSERRAAREETARLAAESELMMLRQPSHWDAPPPPPHSSRQTDSLYNSASMDTSLSSRVSCYEDTCEMKPPDEGVPLAGAVS